MAQQHSICPTCAGCFCEAWTEPQGEIPIKRVARRRPLVVTPGIKLAACKRMSLRATPMSELGWTPPGMPPGEREPARTSHKRLDLLVALKAAQKTFT